MSFLQFTSDSESNQTKSCKSLNPRQSHWSRPADYQTLCYNSTNIYLIKQHYTAFSQRVWVVKRNPALMFKPLSLCIRANARPLKSTSYSSYLTW